jgi:hypothetical protein
MCVNYKYTTLANYLTSRFLSARYFTMLVGKPERKIPLGTPISRLEDNIKMDLREHGVVWTVLICLRIGTSGWLL